MLYDIELPRFSKKRLNEIKDSLSEDDGSFVECEGRLFFVSGMYEIMTQTYGWIIELDSRGSMYGRKI